MGWAQDFLKKTNWAQHFSLACSRTLEFCIDRSRPFAVSVSHTPFELDLISQGRHFTALAGQPESASYLFGGDEAPRPGALSAYQFNGREQKPYPPQRPGPGPASRTP